MSDAELSVTTTTAIAEESPTHALLTAALAYAAKGWRVLPVHHLNGAICSCGQADCRSPAKHPLLSDWPTQATTDAETIRRWWAIWPEANVGLALGNGLIDIECDPRHGGDESLPALERRIEPLPDTVTWISGRGGEHRLFRVPVDAPIRNAASIGRDLLSGAGDTSTGVDVRAAGGFAVAPPSRHANGNTYVFGGLHPDGIDVADLPLGWLDYLTARPVPAISTLPITDGQPIPDGQRNDTLFKFGCLARRYGSTLDEIRSYLSAINRRCLPPLDAEEVAKIAKQASGYEPHQASVAMVEGWAATTLSLPADRRLAFTWFSDTTERKPDWLWRGYLLRGATAVVGGRQGSSKGLFTIDIAARLTRGAAMPDGTGSGMPTKVLIVTREDDPEITLLARLRLAGADMRQIAWSRGDFTDHVSIPSMAAAAAHLATAVREHGIGLVIIDPLGAWVEDDANNGQQIRAVIDPMNRVAADTGCAVLFVAHLRKASADDPMDAFAGSVQVTAACRTAILITPTSEGGERLVRVVKTNFRRPDDTLIYRLHSPSPDPDEPPTLVWRSATGEDLAIAASTVGTAPIVPVVAVLDHLPDTHRPIKDVARMIRRALLGDRPGITVQGVVDALDDAIRSGAAHEGRDVRGARTIGRTPASVAQTAADRALAFWEAHPDMSVREVAKAVGCSSGTAGRARKLAMAVPHPSPTDNA